MPLAPALANTTPLLGVAAALLDGDSSNSALVVAVAVTAAASGVSIIDGKSQVRFGFRFLLFCATMDSNARFLAIESRNRGIEPERITEKAKR